MVHDDLADSGVDTEGTIRVTGCHATDDDLDICICGDLFGSVDIVQPYCSKQVTYSCSTQCPE